MWNALRSDLTEFVSTVTEDTSQVLNRIDGDMDNDGEEGEEPLTAAAQEALRRMTMEETFTTPLVLEDMDEEEQADVDTFLQGFAIESKTEEIASLLEGYEDTLKVQFENLVPEYVTYPEFWQRYFYRCDAERIEAEWEADEEAAKQARKEAVQKTVSTVRNLFGGAVKAVTAVSATLAEDDNGDPTEPGETTAETLKTAGFFTGRPPFVMNTAVDEDEGEEEQLGWDDDDDEDEESESDEEESGEVEESMEQIEFHNEAAEKIQEQLKTAIDERDQLSQTVKMQAEEIDALKKGGAAGDSVMKKEVDQLKIQLFEKESELAAMKESLLDDTPRKVGEKGPSEELDQLTAELASKEAQLNEMETMLKSSVGEMQQLLAKSEADKQLLAQEQAKTSSLEARLATIEASAKNADSGTAELQEQISSLAETVATLQTEKSSLVQELETAKSESLSQITELQDALAAAQQVPIKMADQLDEATARADSETKRADDLAAELEKMRTALKAKEAEVAKLKEDAVVEKSRSPDTVSTGVKVDSPLAAKLALDVEEEADGGWGDDWDDDDV